MPTFKKSKEERGLYNDDMLNEAVNLVVNGNMSVRQAAKTEVQAGEQELHCHHN